MPMDRCSLILSIIGRERWHLIFWQGSWLPLWQGWPKVSHFYLPLFMQCHCCLSLPFFNHVNVILTGNQQRCWSWQSCPMLEDFSMKYPIVISFRFKLYEIWNCYESWSTLFIILMLSKCILYIFWIKNHSS